MTVSFGQAERRVVILDDHQLFAEAIDLALSVEGYEVHRLDVPGNPTAPVALVSAITKKRPGVVLLDLDLGPFGDGARLIEAIVEAGAHVVVVTGSDDRARWGGALQSGARKVVSKTQPLHEIIATVRRIMTGLPVLDREEREELIGHWTRSRDELTVAHERLEMLTHREGVVLGHLVKGRSVRQIAGLSAVSEATVRTQVKSILAKLQVSSQLAAVGLANEIGWRRVV